MKIGLCRKGSDGLIVKLVLGLLVLLIGGIRVFVTDLKNSFLSVGHELDLNDFSYNPFAVLSLAVDEVPYVKFLPRDVLGRSVMVHHELLHVCTQLVDKNIV